MALSPKTSKFCLDIARIAKEKECKIIKPREIDVLDRIGGGDGFVGGLLYGILKGWDVKKCARFGWASEGLPRRCSPIMLNLPTKISFGVFGTETHGLSVKQN